ncbi:M23 family metallopeptidase [Anaerobacillus sp. HL2]|nr:M23 family metallopeptidase [Anaerobacillus sp. HL2]
MNTPIFAAADGKITFADRNGGYGLTIVADHLNTYETLYAHLSEIDVKVGDQVKKAILLGKWDRGRSTGVHLHYEIRGMDNISILICTYFMNKINNDLLE